MSEKQRNEGLGRIVELFQNKEDWPIVLQYVLYLLGINVGRYQE